MLGRSLMALSLALVPTASIAGSLDPSVAPAAMLRVGFGAGSGFMPHLVLRVGVLAELDVGSGAAEVRVAGVPVAQPGARLRGIRGGDAGGGEGGWFEENWGTVAVAGLVAVAALAASRHESYSDSRSLAEDPQEGDVNVCAVNTGSNGVCVSNPGPP